MTFDKFKQKDSVVLVYTGDGKGKTSASVGLMVRALGTGWRVAYIQFIKTWDVGEHVFISKIMPLFEDQLTFYKGGKGFYRAGDISAEKTSDAEHKAAAQTTYEFALKCVTSGEYDLVICDEINNAVNEELISRQDLEKLLDLRTTDTSLCLTGRQFPAQLLPKVDIATNMTKVKHHFDNKFIANKGIDY